MKLIIYTLTSDGQVPDYVVNGGYYAVSNGSAEPQDYNLIGLALASAPEAEVTNIQDYLVSIGADSWLDPEGNPFDLDAAVAQLEALK